MNPGDVLPVGRGVSEGGRTSKALDDFRAGLVCQHVGAEGVAGRQTQAANLTNASLQGIEELETTRVIQQSEINTSWWRRFW